jgi:hypothetical protein
VGSNCNQWNGQKAFFFRDPVATQLSLPGTLFVDLRLPNGADTGSLELFLDGSPVTLDSPTVVPNGISGTVTVPAVEGVRTLSAQLDRPVDPTLPKHTAQVAIEIVDLQNVNECEILNNAECLLPYPSSRFLVDNPGSAPFNDLLISIPQVGMPVLGGPLLVPDPLNELDGFSPTVQILMHFPQGVDVAASDASRLLDPDCCGQLNQTPYQDVRTHDDRSLDADSPTVLMDAVTGQRILHWVEMDARPDAPAEIPERQAMFLRPAASLVPGRRYIVAVRDLVDPVAAPVLPEAAFEALRDDQPSTIPALESRRADMEAIFQTLETNGVSRNDLILAFDFVVQSQHQLTHQMLTMRDEVLTDIDANPGTWQASHIDLASHAAYNAANLNDCAVPGTQIWRKVKMTIDAPNYLAGPLSDNHIPFLNVDANNVPIQNTTPGEETVAANVDFMIPCSVFNGAVTVRPLLLGHGLFGNGAGMVDGVAGGLLDQFADDGFPYIAGATDFRGLSSFDFVWVGAGIIGLLPGQHQLNNFPSLAARLKQGMLHTLILAHLMNSTILNDFAEFQTDPGMGSSTGVFPGASEQQFYVGISLGGIMGTWLAALTSDIERFNVDVPGINFSMLLQRSTQFSTFEGQLNTVGLNDPMDTALGLGLLHEQWVSSEPASAVRHVTGLVDAPLDDYTGSPGIAKRMLMTVAWTDHQVSNQVSEIAARSMALPHLQGSLQQGLVGLTDTPEGAGGLDSALVIYDTGSFDVFDPAFDGVTPALSNTIVSPDKCDPHGFRFTIPASIDQLLEFLTPTGTIKNFCSDDGVCNASSNDERPGGVAEIDLCDPLAP